MPSKIPPLGMFHTHKTVESLQRWIESLSGSEKAMAYMAMGLTWNHLAHVTSGDEATRHLDSVGGPKNQNPYANVEEENG